MVPINSPGLPFPYEKYRDFPTVNSRCVKSPSPTSALFLTVPWHHQHGPAAAALLEKPPAKTVSYFHGILQERTQSSCFQWQPSSFPTVNNHIGFLPHRPTLALGSLPSAHQRRQQALHKLWCTVHVTGMILLTNKSFFSPVSLVKKKEQR